MNEKILIVDDEKEIADLIEVYLKNDGSALPEGADSFRVRYVNCCSDNLWIDCALLEKGVR